MLEITALAVTAVAQVYERRDLFPGDALEVTWRHYAYDPDQVWFLETEIVSETLRQRAASFA